MPGSTVLVGFQQLLLNVSLLMFKVGLGGLTCTARAWLAALGRWGT